MKTIAVIAALDTKGAEAQFIARILRQRGHRTLVIDIGVYEPSSLSADIEAAEVAREGGAVLDVLRRTKDKGSAMEAMTHGAANIAARLHADHRLDAMIGIGGSAGTAISSSAMRALPLGVPKVLVSTVASGDTRPYVGVKDLAMFYSVVDIAGLNRISMKVLANAAGALAGMAETEMSISEEKPLIAASMFGNTTPCVDHARGVLEAAGFEALVFHATGAGGMTMESLIADGYVDGVLDVTTTEWADELCGGVFSAGAKRLDAAGSRGTPQVVAPGCLDMVNFGAWDTVPVKYARRKLLTWNSNVTLMRTSVEENRQLGQILARKLNQAKGPVKLLLPLRGVSQLDSPGGEFWWPEADQALFASLRGSLRADIPVIEIDANINDPEFAERAAQELLRMIRVRDAYLTEVS